MLSKQAEEATEMAIWHEVKAALEEHGEFHNAHEAWAVTREELEELEEAFGAGKYADYALQAMWQGVRKDECPEEQITKLRKWALDIIEEAVQVAAMCDKWLHKESADDE